MDAGIWHELMDGTFAGSAGKNVAQTLALHIDPAFLMIDAQGFCLFANRAMQDMTGFSAADFSSHPVHDLIHHHHPDGSSFAKEVCPLHLAITAGGVFNQGEEMLFYRKDSSTFLAMCRIEPVKHQEKLLCMVMELRDIAYIRQSALKKIGAELTYRLAIEAANIGTWELDLADGRSTISPISTKILGIPDDKNVLLWNEWQGMIFPDDKELVLRAKEAAVRSGESFQLEFRLIRPDGKMIWVASRGIVKKDEQGRPCKAIGVMIDITEKKNTEESQRESARRLSMILESSSEGIYGIEADHHCTFINRAGAAMLGYGPEELIGQPVDRMLRRPSNSDSISRKGFRLIQAVNEGRVMRVEDDVFWRKDGSSFPVAYSFSPIIADGRQAGAVITFADVTKRKKEQDWERRLAAEARAAAAANAKFRTFFERGAHFSGLLDVDGRLIEVNYLALDICGYRREEMVGKKFWECGWWNRSQEVMDAIKLGCEEAAQGRMFRRELPYFCADGEPRVTDLTLAPVIDDAGNVLYLAPTGSDITERKRAEEALKMSESRFRVMAEFSPDAILVQANEGFVYANPSAVRLFGVSDNADILGHKAYEFIAPLCHDLLRSHLDEVVRLNQRMSFVDLQLKRRDGSIAYVHVSSGTVEWEGQPAVQCILRDMTELKHVQDRLRHTSERLQLAIEGSGEGIWDWDIANNRFTFSGGLNRILGRADNDSYSEALEWRNAIHPDDYERVMATFRDALNEVTPLYECEYRLRAKSGDWKWIWARGVIVERDEHGLPLLMTGTLSDITARKESDELAWRHANLDALTGLPGRRLFRERLEMELLKAKRNGHQLAVLFIDLDGFKQINDSYGHDAGDLLLMEAASRLKRCVRETDTVARLGGDEFTVILSELANLDHVELMCQEILSSLAEPFHLGKDIGYISGSIGVSLYPFDAATPDDLLRKADQAMYAAKHTGKNQFNYFTKEMDDRAHTRLHIINELRHALQQEQLEVHYQPVVELKTGKIMKAEALLRWHHPTLGDVDPAEFIPMAEESGLIKQIGNWVFKQAVVCCKQCKDRTGEHFQIGVNKSPIQFMAREADANWLGFLSDQDMPPNSISVEITEGVLLHASAKVEGRLAEFRDAGVEVALDDFGTGYSSMSYLQKFQIDYVKIDQSFVHTITSDINSRTIAETIIIMAHKLGQKVIAEGIETPEQLDYLVKAGCDYGQGFLFAYPVPAEHLVEMVSRQASSQRHPM